MVSFAEAFPVLPLPVLLLINRVNEFARIAAVDVAHGCRLLFQPLGYPWCEPLMLPISASCLDARRLSIV